MVKGRLCFLVAILSCASSLANPVAAQTNELDRVAAIIEKIRQEYVDPVDDAKLVEGCREGLSRNASGFSNVPTSPEARLSAPDSAVAAISEMLGGLGQHAPDAASEGKLTNACLSGMLKGLDRQSAFLDEDAFKEQFGRGRADVAGVGLTLRIEGNRPVVVAPVEGGPADRAGLKRGDVVTKIDSVRTDGLPLAEDVRRLQGPVGSATTLTVIREGHEESLEFTLSRAFVRFESVKWESVEAGYAYIRVLSFREDTVALLARAIETLDRENLGVLKGLILDLRDNPGGLMWACVGASSAFLPTRALVVDTKGRAKDATLRLLAVPEHYVRGSRSSDPLRSLPAGVKSVPMAVLVNHGTDACSEVVAAALQDHKRATIFGASTSGSGTVSTVFPMQDKTALKLTIARFYRPNGTAIDEVGVTPDTILEEGKLTSSAFDTLKDPAIRQAMARLRIQAASGR